MTKRKSKTTLAEKISVHVEGEEPFDRFHNLMQRLVQPTRRTQSTEDKRDRPLKVGRRK